ncbi:Toxin HigB-1 [Paraburkholderia domus]|jgi:toxin HigB-1|uniref:Toxin HigB-1 n=1 Tax=Paraburkholderia domus TaxID=2793075 RepID=A0A9N8MMV8_9BURK|nr:type II toxin-antitoxin system RelE/ParE family toxin [Paraburkholderia domus]MBK5047206.1 type II toxin-antitoxin system RelE/ParE family toxin [Burkholderia sp. R-70006]MBK5059115.1 type II toxin-antitoxin system RelE/ParE family toxin [Burkholderia sp. R-70199]MBK5086129.1 type II toxin-antitoxin system RelE/ParE family toxin [Burkholderia sp. R-69927]MBK5119156.1 type II toxin-antitoxin system RelE/ParE family toxin [Burkholderia sp. R-69980]MBK5163197.1 type II toxin-antitoxin system R
MITTFGDKATAALFEEEFIRSLPPQIQDMARRKLHLIDAAETIEDLHSPPGNRLELLQGRRSGQWSIRINAQWRICFHFAGGNAMNVEIVDYHH